MVKVKILKFSLVFRFLTNTKNKKIRHKCVNRSIIRINSRSDPTDSFPKRFQDNGANNKSTNKPIVTCISLHNFFFSTKL